MNQEEFLKTQLSTDLVTNEGVVKSLQEQIISDCIDKYKKSNYLNLDEVVLSSRRQITAYKLISKGITAKQFGIDYGISTATARKYLKDIISHVSCNKEKRPFIYTVE